jgi:hypothetical protein
MDAIRGIALLGLTATGCSLLVDTDAGVRSDGAAGPHRIADSAVLIGRTVDSQIRFSADPDGPGSCLSEEVAGCEIQTCIGGDHPLPRPDAGEVSVSSTSGEPTSYSPDADGLYPSLPAASWDDGEDVTIAAAGGEVPAFSEVLTGPADVESIAGDYPDPIPRDQPLAVAWAGADSLVAIAIVCPVSPRVQLRCPFPDGLSGEVPVAALERLPACEGSVNVLTEDRRVVEPGPDWLVRVAVRGLTYTTPATIE